MKKNLSFFCLFISYFTHAQNVSIIENLPSFNGAVNAIVNDGSTIYLGGNFTSVGGYYNSYGAGLNITDGQASQIFPKVNGTVNTCIPDGVGGWYLGGTFTKVGDQDRINLAQISKDGRVTDFFKSCALNGGVNALSPGPVLRYGPGTHWPVIGNLYIGGNFTSIGPYTGPCVFYDVNSGNKIPNMPIVRGDPNCRINTCISDGAGGWYIGGSFSMVGDSVRNNIARINANGSVNGWNPNANNSVECLCLNGNTLYVGGNFSIIGGQSRSSIAAIDATSGEATFFNFSTNGPPSHVTALAVSNNYLYAAGGLYIYTFNGLEYRSIIEIDPISGFILPISQSIMYQFGGGDIYSMAVSGTTVYVGGSFTSAFQQPRKYIASFSSITFTPTSWNPSANGIVEALSIGGNNLYVGGNFTTIGGQNRNRAAAIDVVTGTVTGWNPNSNGEITSLTFDGSKVSVAGAFTIIGGLSRNKFAVLDAGTGSVGIPNPNLNGSINALASTGNIVCIGGSFNSDGAQTRNYIADVDPITGAPTPWNPNANGQINALVLDGNEIISGGNFSNIGGQSRIGLAALDAHTGLATSWNPNVSGIVYSLALDNHKVYVGGNFTFVSSQPRNRIASFDRSSNSLTAFNPNANGIVRSIAVNGNELFVGGDFTNIGGQTRNFIASLNAATGSASNWNPNANGSVNSLVLSFPFRIYAGGNFTSIGGVLRNHLAEIFTPCVGAGCQNGVSTWNANANGNVKVLAFSDNQVYAGGDFTSIGGQTRNYLAAINAATGNLTSWNPNANNSISSLALNNNLVYAGGNFTTIGGQNRNRIAAIDATSGLASSWNPNSNNTISAIGIDGNTIYASGNFTSIGGQLRNYIAGLNTTSGLATTWNPNADGSVSCFTINGNTLYVGGAFTSIGGQPRNRIAAFDLTNGLATSWNPNSNGSVYSIVKSGNRIFAGGNFSSIGGQTRFNIASLDSSTGTATSWNPNANNIINNLSLNGNIVFAAGGFTSIGGMFRNYIASIDSLTGIATSWNPNSSAQLNTLSINNNTIYAGGNFITIGGIDKFSFAGINTDCLIDPPQVNYNSPLCVGDNIQLSASSIPGATYQWSGSNGFSSTLQNPIINNITSLHEGTYVCNYTVNGCKSPPGNIYVTANGTTINASCNYPCIGSTLNLFATTAPGTYSWTGPNGFTSTLQNPTIPSVTNASSGTYTVGFNSGVCPVQNTTVTIDFSTTAISDQPVNESTCKGGTTKFTIHATGNQISYQWQVSDGGWNNINDNVNYHGTQFSEISITGTLDLNGKYYRCLISSGCNPTVISDSALLTVTNPIFITSTGPTSFCNGNSTILSASSGINYYWNTGETTQSILVTKGGVYSVSVDGCEVSDNVVTSVTYCNPKISLTVYIEGLYIPSGDSMQAVIDPLNFPSLCDTICLQLADSATNEIAALDTEVINTHGQATFYFSGLLPDHHYYLILRHRNSIQTWSNGTVYFNTDTINYSFVNSSCNAYGCNLRNMLNGKYAIISGDVNQDGIINSSDLDEIETNTNSFLSGYLGGDLNGDWVIESSDYSLIENNLGISLIRP